MKRAVILHGTDATPRDNWFPWLKAELEKIGYEVWAPQLPLSQQPNTERYCAYLLSQGWDFQDNLIVGHSSGAVAILGLLQRLPEGITIHTAVLAGVFTKRLAEDPSWQMLTELFYEPFDFDAIKHRANKFIFVHSADDPYCPIEDARELSQKVGGEFVELQGAGHFSKKLDPRFSAFPELLDIIKQRAGQ